MEYRSVKGFGGWSQLPILLAFIGAGFLLAGASQLIIGFSMLPPGTGMSSFEAEFLKALANPANVGKARLMQVTGTFFLMFIPCLMYLWICHGKKWFWLGFNKHINIYQILTGFAIIFAANLLANPIGELCKMFIANFPALNAKAVAAEKLYSDQVTMLSNLNSWGEYLLALIIMAFLPGLFEEMLFRGALQNLLNRWWKRSLLAIIVSSLIFSFIHASYFLFISRAILGFVLGWMFWRSKNIWVNVIAHFLNNSLVLSALFFTAKKPGKADPGLAKLDPNIDWWWALLALGALIFLMRLFEKNSVKNREIIEQREAILMNKSQPFPEQQNLA